MKHDLCLKIEVIVRYVFFLIFICSGLLFIYKYSHHFFHVLYQWYFYAYFFLHIPCNTFLCYEIFDIYFQYLSWSMCLEILFKEFSLIFAFFDKLTWIWLFIYCDIFLFLLIYGIVYLSLGPFLWPPWFPCPFYLCVFIVRENRDRRH